MGKVAPPLDMTSEQRSKLEQMANSQSMEHRVVRQAKGLILAADGVVNTEIARRCDVTVQTIYIWRKRFKQGGVATVGVVAPGRGRPKSISDDTVKAILHDTIHTVPDDGSERWSVRSLAKRHGVSKDTVARIWNSHGLKPWKT